MHSTVVIDVYLFVYFYQPSFYTGQCIGLLNEFPVINRVKTKEIREL